VGLLYTVSNGPNGLGFPTFTEFFALSTDQGQTWTQTALHTWTSSELPNANVSQQIMGDFVQLKAVDNTFYPTAASLPAMKAVIDPVFFDVMPLNDGWAHAFQCDSLLSSYTIYSQGKDGSGTNCAAGATSTFVEEICLVNGRFQRYPDGPQR